MPLRQQTKPLLDVEAVASRLQSKEHHDGKPCRCCGGEPHVYAAWLQPVDPDPPTRCGDPTSLNDLIQLLAYDLRLRPGTRVRVTIEEVEE